MEPELEKLFKGMLTSLALIGGGIYLKVAKEKEPYASKTLWKTVILVGILGLTLSVILFLVKT